MLADWFGYGLFPLLLMCGAAVFSKQLMWRKTVWLLTLPAYVIIGDVLYQLLMAVLSHFAAGHLVQVLSLTGYYAICAASLIALLRECTKSAWLESLVVVAAGYTLQHIAVGLLASLTHSPLGSHLTFLRSQAASLAFFAVVYLVAYLILGRSFVIEYAKVRSRVTWVLISVVALAFVIVFNMVMLDGQSEQVMFVGFSYDAITSMLLLVILVLISSSDHLYGDLEVMRQQARLAEHHHELAKENIELINIRCHDIRKSIASLSGGGLTADMAKKIENNIRIYDSMFHTGNECLDVLLTEKGLYCTGKGITFTCIADGSRLGFMSDADVYALFGNMLDNAIESVDAVRQPERKIINFTLTAKGGLLVAEEENSYAPERQPVFRDGLPCTTKADAAEHGFGTRSMAWQVHKYQGEMAMKAEDGIFSVSVVLPIPA
ncbi:ATP-binding protein [Bifidobacterium miconisargentati]|uniref:ATP-binding protein n=1 Tax=Bifidobacterium miconisargentati TaxID=2834437 RepID=UPI001BDC4CDF|nr:ATP-binding protein [Bifidobacterium miconisargentati]MBW3090350.1 sensor histidine kinase [Bifidobacterium miconisargentati]